MTRITSFGRKRTYVEAGFGQADAEPETSTPTVSSGVLEKTHMNTPSGSNGAVESTPPKKKKRIRTPKHKRDNYVPPTPAEDTETSTAKDGASQKVLSNTKLRKKEKTKVWREKMEAARNPAEKRQSIRSDSRHPRRALNKDSNTTCLACRKQGHKAMDCPSAKSSSFRAVGICYRCGSKFHSLFNCPNPVDPSNPMPFASCFVCSGVGHLASACPQNAGKGIYPNGGCCKLCGENTHLAKDCKMKRQTAYDDRERPSHRQGMAGADEDDFHVASTRENDVGRQKKLTHAHIAGGPEKGTTQSTTNKRKTVFF